MLGYVLVKESKTKFTSHTEELDRETYNQQVAGSTSTSLAVTRTKNGQVVHTLQYNSVPDSWLRRYDVTLTMLLRLWVDYMIATQMFTNTRQIVPSYSFITRTFHRSFK